ncbi:MAG: hypothetical protein ACRD0S_03890, partial [Acidimicrobiales bacterium]
LAQPASAHATVSLRSPGVGQQLTARGVTVSASVTLGSHPTGNTEVGKVDMTIDQLGTTRGPIRASAAPSGGNVSFPVDLPYNGRYKVTVSATWSHTGLVLGDSTGSATDSREFSVAAPPAPPTDVKAAVDDAARSVTLTWKANTEPDLLFYVIQRAKGTSNEFTVIGKVNEPKFVDASTAEAGGDYRYQVVAVRAGVTAEEGISSDPSALTAESTAKVPDPPPPPTTAPPAGSAAATSGTTIAATASGGTATTLPASNPGALTTSGTVDLKGFSTVQSQARRAAPRPVEPDPGFLPTLPFATRTGEEAEEVPEEGGELGEIAADSPQYRELGADDEASNRQETMAFFAAGLLVTVLLMHVLWVKSEVKRTPLEAITPEGPTPLSGRDELTTTGAKPAKARGGRAKAKPASAETEWFVPGLLDTDEVPPAREKVGVGS